MTTVRANCLRSIFVTLLIFTALVAVTDAARFAREIRPRPRVCPVCIRCFPPEEAPPCSCCSCITCNTVSATGTTATTADLLP